MKLPPSLEAIIQALSRGSRPRLVGGCVRDWVLGLEPKDFDIEVYGIGWETLTTLLAPFGATNVVGKSFGVIKVRCDGMEFDFSLPRRETKSGMGHRGFSVETDASLGEVAASSRRDFTINALLYDPCAHRLIDHFGGLADLERRVLRHVGPAFVEDPLRVLRAFQFAARFDLGLAPETARLCASIKDTFSHLARERIWGEWDKFATKGIAPRKGLLALKESAWLGHFPELAALDGLPQEPAWHPEGDVFVHTGHALDALVRQPLWINGDSATRRVLSFGVLCHDLGKAVTTEHASRDGQLRWVSPGHDRAGGPLAARFLEDLGSPIEMRPVVRSLVENHHAHLSWPADGPSDAALRRLARRLDPATLDLLIAVMEADHLGRPPLVSEETALRIATLRDHAQRLKLTAGAPRPILHGRDLLNLGYSPGPEVGLILRSAFEAQLDGAFTDHAGGVAWLVEKLARENLPRAPSTAPSCDAT